MILIDSDVLIWHTRGYAAAKARLARVNAWRISAVTYMELAQGCRNQQELQRAKRGLVSKNTEIIPITPAICECAMGLIDTYALSAGLQVADALISATAIERQLTVLTANTRHFSAIEGLSVEAFVP